MLVCTVFFLSLFLSFKKVNDIYLKNLFWQNALLSFLFITIWAEVPQPVYHVCEWSFVFVPLGRSVDWAEVCHPPRRVPRLYVFCCMQTDPSCNIHARRWQGPMCQQTGQTNWAIWRLSARISELVVCVACWEWKHVAVVLSSVSS